MLRFQIFLYFNLGKRYCFEKENCEQLEIDLDQSKHLIFIKLFLQYDFELSQNTVDTHNNQIES